MAGMKLDRAWSDFLDSRRIYCIKLFTVGQRIAGGSNLPCEAERERERDSILAHVHAHTHTRKISKGGEGRHRGRGDELRREIPRETETHNPERVRAVLRLLSPLRDPVSRNFIPNHCRVNNLRFLLPLLGYKFVYENNSERIIRSAVT